MIVTFIPKEGETLHVVKVIRDTLKCSLKEAKDFTDQCFVPDLTVTAAEELVYTLGQSGHVKSVEANNDPKDVENLLPIIDRISETKKDDTEDLPAVVDTEEVRKSEIFVSSTVYEGGAKTVVFNEMHLTKEDAEKMETMRASSICSLVGEIIGPVTNIAVIGNDEIMSSIVALRIPKGCIDIEGINQLGEFAEAINEMILDFVHGSIDESRIHAICKDMDPMYED